MNESKIEDFGKVSIPEFTGTRVMMMPFLMEDPIGSLPSSVDSWKKPLQEICHMATVKSGVGYITIDEADVKEEETHRRPGLHVDGMGDYGGGGGGYAANGMFLVSSHVGCVGYRLSYEGQPVEDGDCEHLRELLRESVVMKPGHVYWCSPMAIHESIPMLRDTKRQMMRVSMPSKGPYHRDYTPNPIGIMPVGEPAKARLKQMNFRP